MVGTRTRGLAAITVAGALVASVLAPSLLVAAAGSDATAVAAVTDAPPSAPIAVVVLATPTPGIPDLPPSTRRPIATPDPSTPPAEPRCAPAPDGLAPAPVRSHGSRDRKVVALTFDDGYNPANTLRILGLLRRYHVNATFFVTGRAVELFPSVWRQVVAAGFPIADHTYDHHQLEGLCFATQVRELTHQASVLDDVLGVDPVALMRPPYGARDRNTLLAATAAGDEAVVMWDVDTRDWSGIGWHGVASRALAGGKGSIVLMHTLYATTTAALPHIIAGYRARGFRFVTVGELLGVPGPVPFG